MTYSNVKNAHIVPECYLCAWERNGKLTVHLTGEVSEAFELPARSVGTRRRAYRRERPSGMVIDDVERTLGRIEADAASLLGSPTTWWPPTQDEKTQLALFFGYQIVRGPRWMSWHDALREAHPPVTSTTPDSTARLIAMLKIGAHMSSLVGTMHWTLLEFGRPVIATSDQPVVIWPKAANARTPTPTPFELDDLACSEIRLPLSPWHAILMTWCDEPDDDAPRIRCRREHAASLNAFTVAQADKQWFHHPDSKPPRASGNLLPLAPQLLTRFELDPPVALRRRHAVDAQRMLEQAPLTQRHQVPMYWLSRH